ncbi:MAG TPA: carbohydrate kinase family protein [Candidatus Acidoferrales bacterium]|nr:carbohydrate kinase family protein [Candidatus Acidoferrales bacterium]
MPKQHEKISQVDVCGVGLNATDIILELPRFPASNSKLQCNSVSVLPGGQVASALVACRRWGRTARYVGSVGDDAAAEMQERELRASHIEAHLIRHHKCTSLHSYILLDSRSGERTILSHHDPRLALRPSQLKREWISNSRLLLVDGHDAEAATAAAKWARKLQIPVVADIDTRYPGVEVLLEHTDYLFSSQDFPKRFTKNSNLLQALREISRRFGCRITGATLGSLGAVAWDGIRFHYSPGFSVHAVDTTGAGDVFHAGVAYGMLKGWDLSRILEFSNAAAALNCTALGARGGIKSLAAIRNLIAKGKRSGCDFSAIESGRHEHQ